MAYQKTKKYIIKQDNDVKQELLDILSDRFGAPRAKKIIFLSVPMSLIRWAKWLDIKEFDTYLEEVEDEDLF